MIKEYYRDQLNAFEAKSELQKLTFYPMMFQAARVLKGSSILQLVYKNKRKGIDADTIANELKLSYYGVSTLLETGLSIGLVYLKKEGVYSLTKMGYHLLFDEATKVNLNFTHHVCYKALYHLEESIKNENPEGLKELGVKGKTIYPHLSKLEEPIKTSWFEFDHYYSDNAFPDALKIVFENSPKHILDIGGNTGKWSIKCCQYNKDVKMTIVDLDSQWGVAKENINQLGLSDRISGYVADVLNPNLVLPKGSDTVWMSQFLDCFSEDQIVQILTNINKSMNENTSIFIQDVFWDRQKDLAAAYSLHGTSLYFTAVANGNSKMYNSREFIKLIEKAGLKIVLDIDRVGEFHTIFKCIRNN